MSQANFADTLPSTSAVVTQRTLILGGARSGKSLHAENLAHSNGQVVTYVATARLGDPEFDERVAHHQARRPAHWQVLEAPVELGRAVRQIDRPHGCILIDCLTLWLVNLLCPVNAAQPLDAWEDLLLDFEHALDAARSQVIVVSNEIGLGVVPMGSLTRRYVDELGRLNQRMAARCDRVTLLVAGLPLTIKGQAVA